MKIEVLNRQRLLTIDPRTIEALASGFLERPGPRVPAFIRVTVVLTEDREMRRLKRLHFGQDVTTDVISLAYRPIPGESPFGPMAEVYINVQQAMREARPRRGAAAAGDTGPAVFRELTLYLAHGINHLRGGRDGTARGRASMRRRDLRWVRWAEQEGHLGEGGRWEVGGGRW